MSEAVIDSLLEQHMAFNAAREKYMTPLVANGVPFITALVMAGDLYSADRATERVQAGEDPAIVSRYIGSYARFDWCMKHLSQEQIIPILPELWRGSDPDDTKPEYLALWKAAHAANGSNVVIDGDSFTHADPEEEIVIYRGQVGDVMGISWTTDRGIARKFAKTGGGRSFVHGGLVFTALVKPRNVLAFITNRGESELIIDPSNVTVVGSGKP